MPNSEDSLAPNATVMSYVPVAFLWWCGVFFISMPMYIFASFDDIWPPLLGYVALIIGVPTLVHGTWKIAVAMLGVIAIIAVVAGCGVTWWILANFQIGKP